jgi:hypothetical protein
VGFQRLHYERDTDINKLAVSDIVGETEDRQGNGFNRDN